MKTTTTSAVAAAAPPRFVNEKELSSFTSISVRTWQKHRLFNRGPKFYRICGSVRYDLAEVLAWIRSNSGGGQA